MRHAASILPEHHAGEPAGEQRSPGGGEAVEQAVVARRIGDELREPDLDDLQRGLLAR
jgi:hypothetical protein